MIHRIYSEWRRVFILSATFLLAILVVVACKKKPTTIGSGAIDQTGLLAAGAVDTFTLETYSTRDDSISTKNPGLNVLGEMNDPVFGTIKTSFYTQLRLNSVSPDFGDMNLIKMDSVVLAMQFFNYTGDLSPQTFEVFELNEIMDKNPEVKYYEHDSLEVIGGDLILAGMGTIKPEPIANALIDTVSVAPQMRIPMDTTFGRNLMTEAVNTPTSYASNENFLDYFNGLYITTNNGVQASGEGGVFSLNMTNGASKLTIYYQRLETINGTPTWVKKSYDYVINSSSQSFNRAKIVHSIKVQNTIANKALGLTEFYAQAFGTNAVVNIPGLSNIPSNAIIQKAVLDLPIQFQTGSEYATGGFVELFSKATETANTGQFVSTSSVPVSDFTKSVRKDISGYVQEVVSGIRDNKPIYIYPTETFRSGHRIIFNGPNTLNKVKPKLYIIYTEY